MVVFYPGEVIVESGDVISGLAAGDMESDIAIYVLSGGTVVNTDVFDEGQLIVESGAAAIGTYCSLGMVEDYGGVISNTVAVAGELAITLRSGGEAIDTTLSDAGQTSSPSRRRR